MATWAKIKFFYETMLGSTGSTLTTTQPVATGDFSADYIYNMLETNMWKSANANDQYIQYDAGAGNIKTADYLAIIGHNLYTADVLVSLQYSSTGLWGGEEGNAFTAFIPTDDNVILKEFTSPGPFRYWRVFLQSIVVVPFMTICIWGNKTELDYAAAAFDPHSQSAKANVNITQGGYMAGTHTRYIERSLLLNFADADSILYDKVKTWWEISGLKNFFVAWETANSPADVYFMRPVKNFNNPLANSGAYRNVSINLKGRKE